MNNISDKKSFLIVSIIPQNVSDDRAFQDIKELKELVDAYGGQVVDYVIQKREARERGWYIGKGKVGEVSDLLGQKPVDVIVLNAVVKPREVFEMKTVWQKTNPKIEVWDRVDLILHIFSRHARTAEAKLQIELATMRHMGPRIAGMGYVLSRQAGSIGTRGIGETNTELMKRHWRDQMKLVRDKLEKLTQERFSQLENRKKSGLKTVSLIGYTNAGKTSLFNLLTGKKKLVQNALFATLDSNVGKLYSKKLMREILVSDTIGFIKSLPAKLIDAFKSTLMESVHADVLLEVIDVSDPDIERKISVVENILRDLNIYNKKRIFVFNKIDTLPEFDKGGLKARYSRFNPQFISVRSHEGVDLLISKIEEML